jgi:hypothetical protein
MVIPNPLANDPNAGIIVAAGDPIPDLEPTPADTTEAAEAFDVAGTTGKELDERYGSLDGYPRSAKVDERRAFVQAHLASP